jgi:hypothetical protein
MNTATSLLNEHVDLMLALHTLFLVAHVITSLTSFPFLPSFVVTMQQSHRSTTTTSSGPEASMASHQQTGQYCTCHAFASCSFD